MKVGSTEERGNSGTDSIKPGHHLVPLALYWSQDSFVGQNGLKLILSNGSQKLPAQSPLFLEMSDKQIRLELLSSPAYQVC